MNTPKNEKIKWNNRIVSFEWELFGVLSSKHEEIFNESKNLQSDFFDRLRKAVEEVREETSYNYYIKDYSKRLLAENNVIESTKENLRNHEKLKWLFEELKTEKGIYVWYR